jgi:hypothetical protein
MRAKALLLKGNLMQCLALLGLWDQQLEGENLT